MRPMGNWRSTCYKVLRDAQKHRLSPFITAGKDVLKNMAVKLFKIRCANFKSSIIALEVDFDVRAQQPPLPPSDLLFRLAPHLSSNLNFNCF